MSGDTQNCYKSVFFKRKGLPGYAHFIRPNVYMGKKGAVSCIGINMKPSRVYPLIHYLVTLRETTPEGRKTMLYNITRRQLRAIACVATRLCNGHINPLRRDASLLLRSKAMLRSLSCPRIGFERKKRLLKRHVSKIPVILKTVYLIKTIVDEMVRMNDTVQNER